MLYVHVHEWLAQRNLPAGTLKWIEMVVRVYVTLEDIITDEIMSDYLRITQMFLYQTL